MERKGHKEEGSRKKPPWERRKTTSRREKEIHRGLRAKSTWPRGLPNWSQVQPRWDIGNTSQMLGLQACAIPHGFI